MYCGNCGCEIESGAAFCPGCGEKIEAVADEPQKRSNPKIKKMIRILIPIVAAILVVFAGIKALIYFRSIPSQKEIQAASNNLQNDAPVASDGKWIYYNDNGLCKMRLKDGSRQTVISEEIHPEEMFYLGNNLYYYEFPGYYVLDGTAGKDLQFNVFSKDCLQFDGKRFYVTGMGNFESNDPDENADEVFDGYDVYSTKPQKTTVGTKIAEIDPTDLILQGDYLYIVSGYSSIGDLPNSKYGMWRVAPNGKGLTQVFDYCPGHIVFSGEEMYYTNQNGAICSSDLDGSNETVFDWTHVRGGLNVSEDYIFYIDYASDTIHRIDKDGSNDIKLNNDRSERLGIVGNWIFYVNKNYNDEIYKMSFDGSYNQPIY